MFSDNFEYLLTGCASSDAFACQVIDPRTGVAVWSHKGGELQGATLGACALIGDEHLALAVRDKALLHLVSLRSRPRFHLKSVLPVAMEHLICSPDRTLLFAAAGNRIFTWMLTTGSMLSVVEAHYQPVTALRISRDGSMVVSAGKDGVIHVWLTVDLVTETLTAPSPLCKWNAHTLTIRDICLFGHGGALRVLSASLDHTACVHAISSDQCLLKLNFDRPLTACAIDPGESRLFLGTDRGIIARIDLFLRSDGGAQRIISTDHNDARSTSLPIFKNDVASEIVRLAVNGDGCLLASGDVSGLCSIWDILSTQCLRKITMKGLPLTLTFIKKLPALFDSEQSHKPFPFAQLRKQCAKEKTNVLLAHPVSDPDMNAWEKEVDALLAMGSVEKKNASRNEQVESRRDDDIGLVAVDDLSSLTVEQLKEKVVELVKINEQLYTFASKHLVTK